MPATRPDICSPPVIDEDFAGRNTVTNSGAGCGSSLTGNQLSTNPRRARRRWYPQPGFTGTALKVVARQLVKRCDDLVVAQREVLTWFLPRRLAT